MTRRRWTRGTDANQLQISWDGPQPKRAVETSPVEAPPPEGRQPIGASEGTSPPVLRLRWDFRTRFPQPTPEALDAGLIAPEETGPEAVRAIHDAHATQLLDVLREQDAEAEGCRRGAIVPSETRAEPGPSRLQRWYANLLGVYGDLFGPEAAEALDKAVRAWHARVEVVVDKGATPDAEPIRPTPSTPEPVPVPTVRARRPAGTELAPTRVRTVARLPVPKPLPHAVAAGHFGHDDHGPVSPSADEVRAITEVHAELLAGLVTDLATADRRGAGPAEVARRVGALREAVGKYGEDFGDRAAERLLAYARRRAAVNDAPPVGRGR